jgi:hypothetical protein
MTVKIKFFVWPLKGVGEEREPPYALLQYIHAPSLLSHGIKFLMYPTFNMRWGVCLRVETNIHCHFDKSIPN